MPVLRPRFPLFLAHARFPSQLVALLLVAGAAIGGGVSSPAFAQTSAPGPQLGAGDFINPQVNLTTGTWEAFPADNSLGHVLYIWNPTYVSRAGPCPSASAATPCYSWIQYFWDFNDPYNSGSWTPFQRGCMLLGANPLVATEADGFSRITDIYVAGDTWNPITNEAEPVATLNPLGSGSGSITDVSALDAACAGGPAGPAIGGAQFNISGVWRTTQGNGYSPTFTFTQVGTTITGTATISAGEQARASYRSPTGRVSGTLVGTKLDIMVTWQGANGEVVGRYTGTIGPGATPGTGQIINGSAGGVNWSGTGPAT
jgi:hypothetical protein